MKRHSHLFVIFCLFLSLPFLPLSAQKVAIYNYPVEIELTSDQGDMPTKDYLVEYGTKGKKRGVELMYDAATPFLIAQLEKEGISMLPVETLAAVKANEYGIPSTSLAKAVKTGKADQYMKVYLKDITQPVVEGLTQQDKNSQVKKLIKMRCRIQLYDANKTLLKDAEATFQSGEKMESIPDLGVDLRKYQGSEYLQEVKIYETCTKIAIFRAIKMLKSPN